MALDLALGLRSVFCLGIELAKNRQITCPISSYFGSSTKYARATVFRGGIDRAQSQFIRRSVFLSLSG